MINKFVYTYLPAIWTLYCNTFTHPQWIQFRYRPSNQPFSLNKVCERSDMRRPEVLATYQDIIQRQQNEKSMISINPDCALPGQLEALSAAYWSRASHGGKSGATRPLWPEGRWEYAWIAAHLDLKPGMRILDVGAENSFLPYYFASQGCEVYALDSWAGSYGEYFIEEILDRCIHNRFILNIQGPNGNQGSVTFIKEDVTALSLQSNYFDRVVSISVIEHIPDDSGAMAHMGRVLKPGGILALTTPYAPEYSQASDLPHHKTEDGSWTGDLDRLYNSEALRSRLVKPSGLDLVDTPDWAPQNFSKIKRYQMPGEPTRHSTAAVFLKKSA